jgi:two-component sensor histidine kinase
MNMIAAAGTSRTAGRDQPVASPPAITDEPPRLPLLHDLRSRAWHYRTADRAEPSRFEQLASAAAGISPHRLRLLGMLLAAASPTACGGRAVLRPVWATEAMNRAYNTVRLIGSLEQQVPQTDDVSVSDLETRLGRELAATFDSLAITCDEEPRSCSVPLRNLARDLVELFGSAIGSVAVATIVDRVTLPAYRHRALVLLANELVSNALLCGFKDRRRGLITLQLSVLDQRTARLVVTDDGDGVLERTRRHSSRCGVVDYLADLLESELVCRTGPGGGMTAAIEFPL